MFAANQSIIINNGGEVASLDPHKTDGVAESHVRWSNGEPVTAGDFVYSWQRLVDAKTASLYASYLHYAHVRKQ